MELKMKNSINIILNYANLLSLSDYNEIFSKFPAFSCAKLSKKAKQDNLYGDKINKSHSYYLRSPENTYPYLVQTIDCYGGRGTLNSQFKDGLRVSIQLKYHPQSDIVKNCITISQTSKICDLKEDSITSTAPIVTFGKIKYIWLNKNECENNNEKTMRLTSLEILAKSVPFDDYGQTNDYGSYFTRQIRKQCENEAFGINFCDLTKEEKAMLVKVKLSSKDNYAKATPIFEQINNQSYEEEIEA